MTSLMLLIFITIVANSAANLNACFDRIERLKIKPMAIAFKDIINNYFVRAYCRVENEERHPFSCVQMITKSRNQHTGTFSLSVLPNRQNKTTVINSRIYPTMIPGIFIVAANHTLKAARLLTVIYHDPDVFVYYLCSTDDASPRNHFDDLHYSTVHLGGSVTRMIQHLERFQPSNACHYFPVSHSHCPETTI